MTTDLRLKSEKDFNSVFNKGKRLYASKLTLIYMPASKLKVGYAVSKKHGKSVVRNRIKRLLRESFRSFLPLIGKNFFFVFIPKVNSEYDFHELNRDMEFLLKKGGII